MADFEYNICNQADAELFYKQCAALEAHVSGLKKEKLLEDVDGTLIQKYTHNKGTVVVKNDLWVDALYISSSFDLLAYFEKD